MLWRTPEEYGNGWNNSVPGGVDEIEAATLASALEEYKELAKLGQQRIPTIVLNRTYSPYKGYIQMRAKDLTDTARRRRRSLRGRHRSGPAAAA